MPRTWLSPIRSLAIAAAALLTLLGVPAGTEAGLVVDFRNITVGRQGGTGSFEVVLVSDDPTVDSYDIYGFGMQVDIAGTSVDFTGATTATTAPYLFSLTGSYSYDDPTTYPLGTPQTPPQGIFLLDTPTQLSTFQAVPYTDPSLTTITEWALGLVLFRVPWDVTVGSYVLSVDSSASTFTTYGPDGSGGVDFGNQLAIPFTSNSSIILVVVPEATPSMLVLSGLGVAGVGSILARRRRMKNRREGLSPAR